MKGEIIKENTGKYRIKSGEKVYRLSWWDRHKLTNKPENVNLIMDDLVGVEVEFDEDEDNQGYAKIR